MFTIVTSYINYYKTPLSDTTHRIRLKKLEVLLEFGLPIVIYVSHDCKEELCEFIACRNNKHVRVVPLKKTFFESSSIFVLSSVTNPSKLPTYRLIPKDTFDYMCYLHSKVEYMYHAQASNYFQHNWFLWIDINIVDTWKDLSSIKRYLLFLYNTEKNESLDIPPTENYPSKRMVGENHMYMPVCISKDQVNMEGLLESICWRFCGHFMMGTSKSIQHLYKLYEDHYESFLKTYDTMVWDVNFWAYLEREKYWSPVTYNADHNDSIVQIPLFSVSHRMLESVSQIIPCAYPHLKGYFPSSASFCQVDDVRYVNMRYVNYKYLGSGHCHVYDENGITKTKNLKLRLDRDYKPFCHLWIDDVVTNLPTPDVDEQFQGIEDIRLYVYKKQVKFCATTVNYSGCARNRIVYGEYGDTLKNVTVIHPPTDTLCEKNWIPVIYQNQEYFIYSWQPFRMGKIEKDTLKISITHDVLFPFFQQVRGSSNVISMRNNKGEHTYVCVVHVSVEKTLPKQYYHMFVMLDANMCPIYFSQIFYFDAYGPEYCLGLHSDKGYYILWISRKDRNPLCIVIEKTKIEFRNKIPKESK